MIILDPNGRLFTSRGLTTSKATILKKKEYSWVCNYDVIQEVFTGDIKAFNKFFASLPELEKVEW